MRTSHVAIILLLGVSTRAAACQKIVVPTYQLAGESVFIGTPQTDTVLAGPGTEKFGLNQIGAPPRTAHDIFGQLVHVDRIGSWPDSQRESLRRSGNLIVLVGWDYGADCGRLIRAGSARWMTPGKSGLFFAGTMRDSAHWVEGRPTFDVDATEAIPYTGERAPVGMFGGRPAPVDPFLSPEQLLGLHAVLPFYEQRSAAGDPYEILAPLQSWIREHPDLAHRPPAVDIIRLQIYNAEHLHIEAISTPVAGTYRFTVITPPADTARLFVRIFGRATGLLMSASGDDPVVPVGDIPHAVGYHLTAQGAVDIAYLSATRFARTRNPVEGYFAVAEQPALITRDSTVWLGGANISQVIAAVDPRYAARAPALDAELVALYSRHERSFLGGRFVRTKDGGITFEEIVKRGGVDVMIIRGERISSTPLNHAP